MSRATNPCGWVVGSIALSLALLPAVVSANEQKRHHPERVIHTDEAVVQIIDGTPAASHAPPVTPPTTTERWKPPKPGERVVTSLQTVIGEPGMASPLGGDDVEIASITSPVLSPFLFLQVTADGRLFCAFERQISPLILDVYRSLDGGESWTLWSTFAPGVNTSMGDFAIAEGDVDRVLVTYDQASNGIIAYADVNSASPVWSAVTVFLSAGVNFDPPRFETDAWGFANYYVYAVASGNDGNGRDIWFNRSLTSGSTYGVAYKIGDVSDGSAGFTQADVSIGHTGYAHALLSRQGTTDRGLFYRRAASFAGSPWEAQVEIDAIGNGTTLELSTFDASRADGHVYALVSLGASLRCRYSGDYGATWPGANDLSTGLLAAARSGTIAQPAGGLVIGGHHFVSGVLGYALRKSASPNPAGLAPLQQISRVQSLVVAGQTAIVADPTRGNRIAAVWFATDATDTHFQFDAEWRRDPGYANTEVGFPVAVAGGGQTPPAVAEVDGDPALEIVFGTISGDIHVLNHDGTPVPGWPVNIGSIPYDAPVAVGILVGDQVAVVSGDNQGHVYAFTADGTLMPGWPVTMSAPGEVFVSIGKLGPPFQRYVVATCQFEMRAIPYTGELLTPFWTFTSLMRHPAAIGDIDNDGVNEMVTTKGEYYHAMALGTAPPKFFGWFPGELFSDMPSLADITGDGKLEIAAPTHSGKVFLLNNDGSNYSGAWPQTISPGVTLTSVVFANILGTSEPELIVADINGNVHARFHTGATPAGWPKATGTSIYTSPIVTAVYDDFPAQVSTGVRIVTDGIGHSWSNFGVPAPGWPRNFPGGVEETFAAGDIDNDGRNEIVVLGLDFVSVYDVNAPPSLGPTNHWSMNAHDAQRTGCLACLEPTTDVDETLPALARTSLTARPNPFNPMTTIEYEVARAGDVYLEVFDVAGRRVATLIAGEHRDAGRYAIPYVADGASGVYFARLRAAGTEVTQKIVLLK